MIINDQNGYAGMKNIWSIASCRWWMPFRNPTVAITSEQARPKPR
jgi:hypothetical protein